MAKGAGAVGFQLPAAELREWRTDGLYAFGLDTGSALCPTAVSSNTAVVVHPTEPGAKQILAALMMAKAMGTTVVVYANNNSKAGWGRHGRR